MFGSELGPKLNFAHLASALGLVLQVLKACQEVIFLKTDGVRENLIKKFPIGEINRIEASCI